MSQQLVEAETKKFSLGASTPFLVILQQRDLATAQASELASMTTWENARLNLDQMTGDTLDSSHVVLAEAHSGVVARVSVLPPE